ARGQAHRNQDQYQTHGRYHRLVALGPLRGAVEQGRPSCSDRSGVEEPPEVVGQVLRRCVPLGRFLRDRLLENRRQIGRDRRVEFSQRRRLIRGDLAQDLVAVLAVQGGPEGQELIEGHAERVDVSAAINDDVFRQRLLRAHITQRAQKVAGQSQTVV